jgi:NitT/TauT family transport system ATP-binding protein
MRLLEHVRHLSSPLNFAYDAGGMPVAIVPTAQHGGAEASPTEAAALSLRNVEMRFAGGVYALQAVSFDVAAGELVSIVGPSGCGKSTLLRIVSGLSAPLSGLVATATSNIGYVFQDATLLPWRTVQSNVELLMELHKYPAGERRRLAREAIELVGLAGWERRFPKQLSGGMRMRVSLARSLTLAPSLFLFDEPFGALDEITRHQLNDKLLAIYQSRRFAGIFVTHSIFEACYLSSRVVVMSPRPGRVVASFDLPFPYPRSPDLRFSPEFVRCTAAVSAALREATEQPSPLREEHVHAERAAKPG